MRGEASRAAAHDRAGAHEADGAGAVDDPFGEADHDLKKVVWSDEEGEGEEEPAWKPAIKVASP